MAADRLPNYRKPELKILSKHLVFDVPKILEWLHFMKMDHYQAKKEKS